MSPGRLACGEPSYRRWRVEGGVYFLTVVTCRRWVQAGEYEPDWLGRADLDEQVEYYIVRRVSGLRAAC